MSLLTLPVRKSWRVWMWAARPKTLFASVSPVMIGASCVWLQGGFRWGPALAVLVGAVLLQVVANLANDLFDFEKGADRPERLGPARMVQSGLISPLQMRRGLGVVLAAALMIGGYLTLVSGFEILIVGLIAIVCAIAYTGGPHPLAYQGLGDIFAFVFFGPVAVIGSAYAISGTIPSIAWFLGIPPGFLAVAVLVVNNLRDREQDLKAGKKTLAVRWGELFAVWEYSLLLIFALLIPIILVLANQMKWPGLLVLLLVPWAGYLIYSVQRIRGKKLNSILAQTALLMLFNGVFMSVGLV